MRANKLVAVAGLALLPALLVSAPAHATGNHGNDNPQVCEGLDSGKIDVDGSHKTLTLTAPDGKLIAGYCVKAGSTQQGNGPVYIEVKPPAKSVTIQHPSCKDISHYSVRYVDDTTTPPTTPPTTTPPTTPPTTVPTTEPTTPPTDTPTTDVPPTDTPTTEPTSPATETAPTPTQAVSSATATVPPADNGGDDSGDDDKGVAGEDETAPTQVDAGLAGNTSPGSTTWIATVAGLAGALLLVASGYLMRMRKRGDHRA